MNSCRNVNRISTNIKCNASKINQPTLAKWSTFKTHISTTPYKHSRGGVLEEAVVGVEHLLGQQEEPLAGHAPVVQPLLQLELDPEPRLQDVGPLQGHDAAVRLLEDVVPVQLHLEAVGNVRLDEGEEERGQRLFVVLLFFCKTWRWFDNRLMLFKHVVYLHFKFEKYVIKIIHWQKTIAIFRDNGLIHVEWCAIIHIIIDYTRNDLWMT